MITTAIIMMSLIPLLPVISIISLSVYFLPAFLMTISTQMFCSVLFLQAWNDTHHPQTQILLFPPNILMSVFPWQNKDCLSQLNSDLNSHGEKVGLLEEILAYRLCFLDLLHTKAMARLWGSVSSCGIKGGQGTGQVLESFPFLSLPSSVTQSPGLFYLSPL